VACFFYDFGPPFDRPVDAATRPYIERLQQRDIRVFCWDRQALAELGDFGVAAEYLPMAVNEAMFFPPPPGSVRDLPVVFSGGPTPERVAALRPLANAGLSVYGYDEDGWMADAALAPCYRGVVAERDRLRDLYQRARITVNVTRAHGRASINMRVFEAMACGCLVVTDQGGEAATLFDIDRDLVTVPPGTTADTVALRYLADDVTRARLADRGAAAVRESHTYAARLQAITPRLKAFVSETRAWAFWDQFILADATKALRFVEALRADRALLREDLWHLADTTAQMRLGRWDLARRSLELARQRNPALLRLQDLRAALHTH
jgi:spore maturation protein CgeB